MPAERSEASGDGITLSCCTKACQNPFVSVGRQQEAAVDSPGVGQARYVKLQGPE